MDCDVLYLSGFYEKESETLSMTIESYIVLFVYRYCDLSVEICFKDVEETNYAFTVPSRILDGLVFRTHKADKYSNVS